MDVLVCPGSPGRTSTDTSQGYCYKVTCYREECMDPADFLEVPFDYEVNQRLGCGFPWAETHIIVPGLGSIRFVYDCNTTSGCGARARLQLATESMRQVAREILRRLWARTVEVVRYIYIDGHWWEVEKWKPNAELDELRVPLKCSTFTQGEEVVGEVLVKMPVTLLAEIAKEYKPKLVRAVEEARREIEELIRRLEEKPEAEELDIEPPAARQLRQKARTLLRILDIHSDELEVE